jgi:hypothetical protein
VGPKVSANHSFGCQRNERIASAINQQFEIEWTGTFILKPALGLNVSDEEQRKRGAVEGQA